jgi:hypothetical protein
VLVSFLLLLIPALGWTGAAWSILAAEAVQASLLLVATDRVAGARARLASHAPSPQAAGGLR